MIFAGVLGFRWRGIHLQELGFELLAHEQIPKLSEGKAI